MRWWVGSVFAFVLLGCTSVEFAVGGADAGAAGPGPSTGANGGGGTGTGAQSSTDTSSGAAGGPSTGAAGPGSGAGGAGGAPECVPIPSFDLDPHHCGSCDHVCTVGDCSQGECQPAELTANLDAEGRGLTIAEDRVVWLLDGPQASRGVWSLPVTAAPGALAERLHQTTGLRIAYRAPHLYWANGSIYSFNLINEDANQTFPSPGFPSCVDYLALDDDGRLYCRIDLGAQESVRRFSNPTGLGSYDFSWGPDSYEYVRGMVVVGDDLWFGRGAGLARWSTTTDTGQTFESELIPGDVIAEGTTLFFGAEEGTDQNLMSYEIGDAAVSVLTPQIDAEHLHADALSVYVAGEDATGLHRVDRATGAVEATWTSGNTTIRGLAGTPTDLFFTTEDGRLFRMTK